MQRQFYCKSKLKFEPGQKLILLVRENKGGIIYWLELFID